MSFEIIIHMMLVLRRNRAHMSIRRGLRLPQGIILLGNVYHWINVNCFVRGGNVGVAMHRESI
jgi:hypothetical protein